MSESKESPASDPSALPTVIIPRPTALGVVFALSATVALTFGLLRGELAAILWSSIVIAVLLLAFMAVFLASAIRRSALNEYECRIHPRECKQGDRITASAHGRALFRPLLVLVRYRIDLLTADGRRTEVSFDPERTTSASFDAGGRGAYFASRDSLELTDAFEFFCVNYKIPAENGARLLVRPAPTDEETRRPRLSGGAELRTERTFHRTEDLTDNRRYTPGDDPRRINWKIYGHAGELFVREGEPEPPPRSRFVILVDATVDPDLFDPHLGRRAVDALTEKALGLVNAVIAAGYEARFGFNGSEILSGDARAAAAAFALPAALAPGIAPPLPYLAPADGAAVVLALPRRVGPPSALENFLQNPRLESETDIFFVVPSVEGAAPPNRLKRILFRPQEEDRWYRDTTMLERAATDCIAALSRRRGVHARRAET